MSHHLTSGARHQFTVLTTRIQSSPLLSVLDSRILSMNAEEDHSQRGSRDQWPWSSFSYIEVLSGVTKSMFAVGWKKALNKINPEITLKLCVSIINTEGSQNRSELKTHSSGKVFFHLPSATCSALPPAAAPIPLQTHGCPSPSCSPRSFPASSADLFELAAALAWPQVLRSS